MEDINVNDITEMNSKTELKQEMKAERVDDRETRRWGENGDRKTNRKGRPESIKEGGRI